MERRITTSVPVNEIQIDEEIYPRSGVNWLTVHVYGQSMKTGAVFPPITLAIYRNKKYLIDGRHRLQAVKNLKIENIDCEVFTGWDYKRMFEESIRRNIAHGRVLSPFEKRKIAYKLMQMKYPNQKISELIQVPINSLSTFIEQRLVNTLSGKTIAGAPISQNVVVKSGIKHLAGQNLNESVSEIVTEDRQKAYSMQSQLNLIGQLVALIKDGLIDIDNPKVRDELRVLINLLKDLDL